MTCRSTSLVLALALAAGVAGAAVAAQAAPDRCGRIKGYVQRQICADPRAADYQASLGKMLQVILGNIREPKFRAMYADQQKRWEAKVRDACRTHDCIYKAYDTRMDQLNREAHEDGFAG